VTASDLDLRGMRVDALLDAVGARTPVPGGGAVAALTMALGVALGRMVVVYSEGKKSLAAHADLHAEAMAAFERLGAEALDGAAEDARAYGRLNDLWKLDEQDERRRREFPGAVRAAIAAPRGVMEACIRLLNLVARLDGATNRMLASDLAIAAILAEAAARSAAWNVRINLPLLADRAEADAIDREVDAMLMRAAERAREVEAGCAARP